jgi:hypothetical protein
MKREPWEPDENGDTFAIRLKKIADRLRAEDSEPDEAAARARWRWQQGLVLATLLRQGLTLRDIQRKYPSLDWSFEELQVLGWSGSCTGGTKCNAAGGRSIGFECTAATCSGLAPGSQEGQFTNPVGLTIDAQGNLFVVDLVNRVQQFDSGGQFVRQFGGTGTGPGQFRNPVDVAAINGEIAVADFLNTRIQTFRTDGTFMNAFGGGISLSPSLVEKRRRDESGTAYRTQIFRRLLSALRSSSSFRRNLSWVRRS